MTKYISIAEYAKLQGTTVQNIYNKINREKLKVIEKKEGNGRKKKYIGIEIDDNLNNNDEIPIEEEKKESNETQKNYSENDIISFLKEQLREKDRQLAEKDKQIEKIQILLDQEQQLHARTKLMLMENKQEEKQPEKIGYKEDKEIEEIKGFWRKVGYWLTH